MVGEHKEQGCMSVKQNHWETTERRWASRFNNFWCLLIQNQHRSTASFTVLALAAIINWKLKPIFSELLLFWAWICRVHKQAQRWQWLGWGMNNSHRITQDWRLQVDLMWDSWAPEQGYRWRSQVRVLRSSKCPNTWNGHTAVQLLVRVRGSKRRIWGIHTEHSTELNPSGVKYDSIPA